MNEQNSLDKLDIDHLKSIVLEESINAIGIIDLNWNLLYANKSFLKFWHYNSFNEVIGQNILKFGGGSKERSHAILSEIVTKGFSIGEHRFKTRDGKLFMGQMSGTLIKNAENDPICVLLEFVDVTERRKAEAKLEESEQKYREAFDRTAFYKDLLTHDMNNILSNIKSSIQLSAMYLKDPNRITDVEELYKVIQRQFTKGSSLVSNIRKLSKIEESVSLLKPVEINDILKKEIDFILNSYQTQELTIRTHGFEKLLLVNANDLLIDLFNNLFNNSIKYNDSHVVEIEVKISREKKNNTNYVKLEFLDNGIGILDKQKDTLFEKEYVKDISSKGLGIGLTLVKKIVESYKGEIWVEDRIEGDYAQGCNFVIIIPEIV